MGPAGRRAPGFAGADRLRTGLAPRFRTAILWTGLMIIAPLTFGCGRNLVWRSRMQAGRLACLRRSVLES